MTQRLTDIQLNNEDSLKLLLEDFSKHEKKMKTNINQKVNTKVSFQERARLGNEALAKQLPVTLSQARAQAISVMIWSVSRSKEQKDEAIKYNLRMYFPELSEEQINDGIFKLYSIYNESETK
ncbi:MAG: hypothetical protein A3F72_13070 [Bacteroidetes bacterium RIFCSPLOWO2_12_FULL_35_15]|nr:MAG: hypothetical protein A3F72_13070 [Bacteroidetes bacterium RIFCSPLOWO2_12_FULL_35_15]